MLGAEETSVELHTPQLDLGLCRSTTTSREVVGVSVSRMIDVRTGSISTKKIKVNIYHDNPAEGKKTRRTFWPGSVSHTMILPLNM